MTLIPEEFPGDRVSINDVCSVLEGAILKRRTMGREDGVVVIAEGIGERLDPDELAKMPGVEVEYDPYGHIRLGEIPLPSILRREVQRRFEARGDKVKTVEVSVGYALRCAQPIPFDIDYTRTLGNGAVRFLLAENNDERLKDGGIVCLEGGDLRILPYDELMDPATGRTRVRLVDINSDHYKVARKYMIRLEKRDLEDSEMRARLMEVGKMTSEQLDQAFAPILKMP